MFNRLNTRRLWAFGVMVLAAWAAITASTPAQERAEVDVSKRKRVERPAHLVVAKSAAPSSANAGAAVNAKVAPGNVRWHATFAAACQAAAKSGKPVLLFQMLGNLDEEFC